MDARFAGITEITETPSVAVVIDVMRAFTVTAWAFAQGADRIVLAGSLDEALALKARHPGWVTLKDGPPAPGFDLVNSPDLLRSADLAGRTVVQKTTNGTVGALAVRDASLVLCAGFVVAEATARLLRARGEDVTFVVTGDDGRAEEDLACAQYIAGRAAAAGIDATESDVPGTDATESDATKTDATGTDAAKTDAAGTDAAGFLRRAAGSRAATDLADKARRGAPGVRTGDVALCLEVDRFPFAMVATLEGPLMVLRPRMP